MKVKKTSEVVLALIFESRKSQKFVFRFSVFGRRSTMTTGATDSTTMASMKSVSFAPSPFPSSLYRPGQNRAKTNKFCLIVVDKTITIDHRIFIGVLLTVFVFLAKWWARPPSRISHHHQHTSSYIVTHHQPSSRTIVHHRTTSSNRLHSLTLPSIVLHHRACWKWQSFLHLLVYV